MLTSVLCLSPKLGANSQPFAYDHKSVDWVLILVTHPLIYVILDLHPLNIRF